MIKSFICFVVLIKFRTANVLSGFKYATDIVCYVVFYTKEPECYIAYKSDSLKVNKNVIFE